MSDGNPHVFGYGSLIWNPGFDFVTAQRAVLHGAHRALAVYSHRHRGTPEQPGLVFGLMRGGSCPGMAFEVAKDRWDEVFAYLEAREQDRGVYRTAWRPVRLADGRVVRAVTYLVNEQHSQYAGRLSIEDQARLVLSGTGESGPNTDYVRNTARRLGELGIRDRRLDILVAALDLAGR
jgi:cation transport protein ChaC